MKKLSTKWKLFYGANIYVFLIALLMVVLATITLFDSQTFTSTGENVMLGLFFFALLSMLLNSFFNLFLLNQFYPEKIIPRKLDRLSLIAFCINIITWFLLTLAFIISTASTFQSNVTGYRAAGFITFMVIVGLTVISQLYALILQLKLPTTIVRNNRTQVASLIESIGQS